MAGDRSNSHGGFHGNMDLPVDSYPYAGFRKEIVGGGMEFYSYVNIFETKGLEYPFVDAFFLPCSYSC